MFTSSTVHGMSLDSVCDEPHLTFEQMVSKAALEFVDDSVILPAHLSDFSSDSSQSNSSSTFASPLFSPVEMDVENPFFVLNTGLEESTIEPSKISTYNPEEESDHERSFGYDDRHDAVQTKILGDHFDEDRPFIPPSHRASHAATRTCLILYNDDDESGEDKMTDDDDDEYRPNQSSSRTKRRASSSASKTKTRRKKTRSSFSTKPSTGKVKGRKGSQRTPKGSDPDILRCEYCSYQKHRSRKPDFERHLKIHLPKSHFCRGVPVSSVQQWGISPDSAYEWHGEMRVGGCKAAFSRADSLQRHLDNPSISCVGSAYF